MKSRQQGFAVLEATLILVVLAAIGFTGWYVWHSKMSAENAHQTQTDSSPSVKKQPELLTYQNRSYNFEFSYPSQWGKASLFSDSDGTGGKDYLVGFPTNEKFSAYFQDEGWQPSNDPSSSEFQSSPSIFNGCQQAGGGSYSVYATSDSCVAIVTGMVNDDSGGKVKASWLVIQKKLLNSKAPALEFIGAPYVGIKNSSQGSMGLSPKKFFENGDGQQTYIDLAESIKAIN